MYHVYIATNKRNTVLYTGVTNNIERRMYEHRRKLIPGFTSHYNVQKLIYAESFPSAAEAIAAEKKIKEWTRKRKTELIEERNPEWNDLLNLE